MQPKHAVLAFAHNHSTLSETAIRREINVVCWRAKKQVQKREKCVPLKEAMIKGNAVEFKNKMIK